MRACNAHVPIAQGVCSPAARCRLRPPADWSVGPAAGILVAGTSDGWEGGTPSSLPDDDTVDGFYPYWQVRLPASRPIYRV